MDEPSDTAKPKTRRDFIIVATGAVALGGVAVVTHPLFKQMAPAADTIANAGIYVDLSKLQEGQELRLNIGPHPVAIRHRTPAEIASARADDKADLRDPQTDQERLLPLPDGRYDPRFLVFIPICTHFGCIVMGEAGNYNGWYCPCHGAHFDTSGRIRSAPAPTNLAIPDYHWVSESVIKFHPAKPA